MCIRDSAKGRTKSARRGIGSMMNSAIRRIVKIIRSAAHAASDETEHCHRQKYCCGPACHDCSRPECPPLTVEALFWRQFCLRQGYPKAVRLCQYLKPVLFSYNGCSSCSGTGKTTVARSIFKPHLMPVDRGPSLRPSSVGIGVEEWFLSWYRYVRRSLAYIF